MITKPHTKDAKQAIRSLKSVKLPGRVVLVLQGGGALGAYQIGVCEALHDAGIDPEWVIGTSIGAINASIIAGNTPENRIERLLSFWDRIQRKRYTDALFSLMGVGSTMTNMETVISGVPHFFEPNPMAMMADRSNVGVEKAAYYSTEPLRKTLNELVDFDLLNQAGNTRLTVGAVNVTSGEMRYFDTRKEVLNSAHVMASGALPPAFGAVRIDGEAYWDGGIYSNTPIEAVLDDNPRRDSLIFAVNVWHQTDEEPQNIQQVMGRQKDIQFGSRADSHLAKQKQIHRLRHVIRELAKEIPEARRKTSNIKQLAAWGCGTTVHVAHLLAPRLAGEDRSKDIDFTSQGVQMRRDAGYADTLRMIERSPWSEAVEPIEGVIEYR